MRRADVKANHITEHHFDVQHSGQSRILHLQPDGPNVNWSPHRPVVRRRHLTRRDGPVGQGNVDGSGRPKGVAEQGLQNHGLTCTQGGGVAVELDGEQCCVGGEHRNASVGAEVSRDRRRGHVPDARSSREEDAVVVHHAVVGRPTEPANHVVRHRKAVGIQKEGLQLQALTASHRQAGWEHDFHRLTRDHLDDCGRFDVKEAHADHDITRPVHDHHRRTHALVHPIDGPSDAVQGFLVALGVHTKRVEPEGRAGHGGFGQGQFQVHGTTCLDGDLPACHQALMLCRDVDRARRPWNEQAGFLHASVGHGPIDRTRHDLTRTVSEFGLKQEGLVGRDGRAVNVEDQRAG